MPFFSYFKSLASQQYPYTRLQTSTPPRPQQIQILGFRLQRRRLVLLIFTSAAFVGLLLSFVVLSKYRLVAKEARQARENFEWEHGDCPFLSPTVSYLEGLQRVSGTEKNLLKGRAVFRNGFIAKQLSRRTLSTSPFSSNRHKLDEKDWQDEEAVFTKLMGQKYGKLAHHYSASGHVEVNRSYLNQSVHPIPELLELGERKWEALIKDQSTSFEAAQAAYRRRNNKEPPRGFDVWWDYAVNNSVLLVDEYDFLHSALLPFYALPPSELRQRAKEVEDYPETFVIAVKNGKAELELKEGWEEKWPGTRERGQEQLDLMKDFEKLLPDLRATFSLHDSPQLFLPYDIRSHFNELAWNGKTTKLEEPIHDSINYTLSCPTPSLNYNGGHDDGIRFIFNQQRTGDICLNPNLLQTHGTFIPEKDLQAHPQPRTRHLPILSYAKTSINSDIPVTPLDQFNHSKEEDPRWDKKKDHRLVWRGSTTGLEFLHRNNWRASQRPRLYHLTNSNSTELVTVMAPDLNIKDGQLKMKMVTQQKKNLTEFYYDVKLTGKPIQCGDGSDGTCDEMRLLSTNSLIFKSTVYPEWHSKGLIPWFHYIPVNVDYSDLASSIAFFRGTPEDEVGFDEVAQAIARNGMCFTRRLWRKADMQAYMLRLYLELAELLSEDRT